MVSAGCIGAGTLSQAKIFRPECLAQVALYSERSHCTFASQYLASQHLYRLELIDIGGASKAWFSLATQARVQAQTQAIN